MILLGYDIHRKNMIKYNLSDEQKSIHIKRVKNALLDDIYIRGYESVRISQMLWACNRDGSDEISVRKRVQNQKVDLQKANFIIENDGGLDKLEAQTELMLEAAANRILK